MEWIDICFNLTHESFNKERDEVLERAREAGVSWMLITGADAHQSEKCLEIADQYPECCRATLGVHPHLAKQWTDAIAARFSDLAGADENVVAMGEMGLDYNRDHSPRPQQRIAFEAQLELSADLGLPVFLHERDAHHDFARILGRWRDKLPAAVVHCFTGEADALAEYLDLDCHIGITGWVCDERRGTHLHPLVPTIPRGRLMIETDAPYLLPRSLPKGSGKKIGNGRRNEPAFLPHIGEYVAQLRDETPEDLAAHTTATARAFYKLPETSGV